MTQLLRVSRRFWFLLPLCALAFLAAANAVRVQRVLYVSNVAGSPPQLDGQSPTGYHDGLRHLVVPEHNSESYQWIMQTQQAAAAGEWRLRHVEYDNAPVGRPVQSSSLYRWWLSALARLDQLVSGRSFGLAVERAALWAEPLLHGLLVLGVALWLARRAGTLAAALAGLGLALLYPFAGWFYPGQPGPQGWAHALALLSVLPLIVATAPGADDSRRRKSFAWAGGWAAVAVWVSGLSQLPVVAGIAVGALLCAALARRTGAGAIPASAWRTWAAAGAATTMVAYLIEFFPAHLAEVGFKSVHPLLALSWLGLGETLTLASAGLQKQEPGRRAGLRAGLAVLALLSLPTIALLKGERSFFADDPLIPRLALLPGSPIATTFFDWVGRDGLTLPLAATLLPLALLVPALWALKRARVDPARAQAVALACGPVIVALVLSGFYLRWWALLDALLVALVVAGTSGRAEPTTRGEQRIAWAAALLIGLLPGLALWQPNWNPRSDSISTPELVSLIERDLAQWLTRRAGPAKAVVLTSPELSASLAYYGGQRVLASPYRENRDGFVSAVRIAGAATADEALGVAERRGLTHIIVCSWDPFLDEYARLGSNKGADSLVSLLKQWMAPRWLQAVPYALPQVAGFEGQVSVFERVELQDNALALSRLAEYFVEMGLPRQAHGVSYTLEQSFPTDIAALVARVGVARALEDGESLGRAVPVLLSQLAAGADQNVSWDRRVSLAIVLADGKRMDLARPQLLRCLEEADEDRLRALSPVALFRLQRLARALRVPFPSPAVEQKARDLLPAEFRERL